MASSKSSLTLRANGNCVLRPQYADQLLARRRAHELSVHLGLGQCRPTRGHRRKECIYAASPVQPPNGRPGPRVHPGLGFNAAAVC